VNGVRSIDAAAKFLESCHSAVIQPRRVLTSDIDEYYKQQTELYLAIDEVIASSGVELA